MIGVALWAAGASRRTLAQPDTGRPQYPPARSPADAGQAGIEGGVEFVVDGQAKRYDHLPAGHNYYNRMGSRIAAKPAAGATEQLAVTLLGIDLGAFDFPVELPPPRAARPKGNPLAAMANVGFSYVDASGQEWAGPGKLLVEAFGPDGVLEGRFSVVSIPHTGKRLPNTLLDQGRLRVLLSRR
ncbi:MAG TPA: hypothetical protein VK052_04870 [Zeimonas sp.]|nr:hypothetical protein [Zeimonas sp.]